MTQLPKVFKQTCNKPYIRHHYKLVYDDGKEVIFDTEKTKHLK